MKETAIMRVGAGDGQLVRKEGWKVVAVVDAID